MEQLADVAYDASDVGAPLASSSFPAIGMVIIPCSMRTQAAAANGDSDNFVSHAADVMLAERRRLVLATRETPLSYIHLRNMAAVTEAGATVLSPFRNSRRITRPSPTCCSACAEKCWPSSRYRMISNVTTRRGWKESTRPP